MLNSLELRVRKTIHHFRMLAGGEHVLVAVSGGPDSVALLLCLKKFALEYGFHLTVGHLNHGIRDAEAAEDEQFVSRLSSELNLRCISESINLKSLAESQKRNLEELAREKRYEFLIRTAIEIGASNIAVGHTMNDQAETTLFRFIRGSGMRGLSAIHPRMMNGMIIRPLIECTRASIVEYLQGQKAEYREDSTNSDPRYSRNRLRQEIIPLLERQFNPGLIPTLAREADLAREAWSYIESQAQEVFLRVHTRKKDAIALKIPDLLGVHPALQKEVLRKGIQECLGNLRSISSIHIQSIVDLFHEEQSGSRIQLPHGCTVLRQFNEILISSTPFPSEISFGCELQIPGHCTIPEIQSEFSAVTHTRPETECFRETCSTQAFFETANLPEKVLIRSRQPGDRYGGPGHRKVKRMLIDSKIPVSARSSLPMVVYGDKIIWVPGFRPAPGFEVNSGSATCICIRMKKLE